MLMFLLMYALVQWLYRQHKVHGVRIYTPTVRNIHKAYNLRNIPRLFMHKTRTIVNCMLSLELNFTRYKHVYIS